MTDEVTLWSDELASDPSSLAFLPLAETLRRRGQIDLARKVALRGLERHPHNADAHDQLARIHADAGDMQSAFDEWDMVLRLAPGHVGAVKGMAFIRFQQGELAEAERLLVNAQANGDDPDLAAALSMIRQSTTSGRDSLAGASEVALDPRLLFADLLAADLAAILLDSDGLVLAGAYYLADGSDVAADVGATLSGVSGEAVRATRHLDIGAWRSIVFETDAAVVTLAPAPAAGSLGAGGGLIVLVAHSTTPLGLVKRLLDKCISRARNWLEGGGAT